jgi:hypothetical protein
LAEPVTLVRSPTLTNSVVGADVEAARGRRGAASLRSLAARRAAHAPTASAIAGCASGVVPQQPPTMLSRPDAGELADDHAPPCGRRLVVAAEGVGQAGVGVGADVGVGDARQLLDVLAQFLGAERAVEADGMIGLAWRTEFQNASAVWPDSVRPEASVMVPEIITGSAAFVFEELLDREDGGLGVQRVEDGLDQQQVGAARGGVRNRPPAASKVTLRKPGSFTSGDSEQVREVGPEHAGDEARLVRVLRGVFVA